MVHESLVRTADNSRGIPFFVPKGGLPKILVWALIFFPNNSRGRLDSLHLGRVGQALTDGVDPVGPNGVLAGFFEFSAKRSVPLGWNSVQPAHGIIQANRPAECCVLFKERHPIRDGNARSPHGNGQKSTDYVPIEPEARVQFECTRNNSQDGRCGVQIVLELLGFDVNVICGILEVGIHVQAGRQKDGIREVHLLVAIIPLFIPGL
mmetsp:Transcript_11732/g.27474  ORF Transcript_11732/g.27474 Transcript_11732/m.27474 type:complete len:207 (+) Transcript_11732:176-796(+)